MFKNKLYNIVGEIYSLSRTREDVLEQCISEKLDNAFNVYYSDLTNTINYLLSKNSLTVLKGLTKELGKEKHD